jgi:hypothetical protein
VTVAEAEREVLTTRLRVVPPWEPGWPAFKAAFEAAWLTHLITHQGEWCHASDALPPGDPYERALLRKLAHDTVCAARRLGLVVESDNLRGYCLTGHAGLPRYLHLHERAEDRDEGPAPGQLTMVECEGIG